MTAALHDGRRRTKHPEHEPGPDSALDSKAPGTHCPTTWTRSTTDGGAAGRVAATSKRPGHYASELARPTRPHTTRRELELVVFLLTRSPAASETEAATVSLSPCPRHGEAARYSSAHPATGPRGATNIPSRRTDHDPLRSRVCPVRHRLRAGFVEGHVSTYISCQPPPCRLRRPRAKL